MIIDKRLELSAAQALTATAVSTNSIDLGSARKIGPGEPMWLVIVSKVAPGGTSPTIAVTIETDDNSAFSSASIVGSHPAIAGAAFGAGTRLVIPFPWSNEQHVRARYTLAGTSPTFTVDAFVTNQEPVSWESYPDGI